MSKFNNFFERLKFKFKSKKMKVKKENERIPNLKFKGTRRPKMIFTTSLKPKKALIFIIPLLVAGGGITLGVLTNNANKGLKEEVIIDNRDSNYRVFVLTKDNMVVPVSLKVEEKLTKEEQILDVFSLLKEDQKYENGEMNGFIPSDTKLNDINVENGILTLDFSIEFNNIKQTPSRVMEALTYSFLGIEGIDGLSLRIDGSLVDKVANDFKIPLVLDKTYGINKRVNDLTDLLDKEEITVIYNKKINDRTYYTPSTVLAKKGDNRINTLYNALSLKPNIIQGLSSVKEYSYLNVSKDPVINEQVVSMDILPSAMIDEVTISKELFDLMNLTFEYSNLDYKVNLTFEGESYAVDGILNEDDYKVSNILVNEVEL